MGAQRAIALNGQTLHLAHVIDVARHGRSAVLDPTAKGLMERSLAWVLKAANGELLGAEGESLPVYGVNTGYGSLARVRISHDRITELSWNLIRSHAAGVGPAIGVEATRAMMLLRANALARGSSGCRPALVETLCAMLDRGVTPIVPSRGSCGSSGDLAPLAHLGLVVFRGEDPTEGGQARYQGEVLPAHIAMERAGIQRLIPGPKEGLAMTNGAQLSCAIAALTAFDAGRLVQVAEIAAAMSWEALRGVTRALHPQVHALRPYPGAIATAGNLRELLAGSSLVDSTPGKVQDAYSLRCTPMVVGAVRDALTYSQRQLSIELNAVTDNPVILVDAEGPNKAFSAGLFHGEPVGFAADHAKLALCELGALAERRIYRLTTGALSSQLPPLLTGPNARLLGLMVPQTTAAALVATNRQLCAPASAETLPTCEDQEDHVAMSTTAARRAAEVLTHTEQIIAIELLSAARGLQHRLTEGGVQLGRGTTVALAAVLEVLEAAGGEVPAEDLAALHHAIRSGTILNAVQQACCTLESVHV